ncbi:dihydroorotase family protein [Candidatus Bathyarchaeota archaeon]|nr:dihydroorotase family protein [Candidatus Bathyarchaeota archaeon]
MTVEADWNVIGRVYMGSIGLMEGGVSLSDGRIVKVGRVSSLPRSREVFKRRGAVIVPGLIDCHVHLRGLNLSYKEDFYTGTCAAAAGGFATVLDMPNTDPPTDSPQRLKDKMGEASRDVVVDVGFHAYPPKNAGELLELRRMGAASIKFYMPILDSARLEEMLPLCGSLDIPVTVHPESRRVIEEAFGEVGRVDSIEDFLYVHSVRAEVEGVREALRAGGRSARIHLCHISSRDALRVVEGARSKGISCSVEATPHHLTLTYKDLARIGAIGLTVPPLRDGRDLDALWSGLMGGGVDVVGSDHAPHSLDEKLGSDLEAVPPGIPGLETTLPLLTTFISQGRLSIDLLVKLLAENPSRIFDLKGKGYIREGFRGDLTVIDLESTHVIRPESFKSKAKYSPFSGFKCKGRAAATFVGGSLAMEDGEVLAKPGSGRVLRNAG